ncbi:MAG TPA: carboxymuconolactone decarboxylase family protein [Thermoanaerobaculia bacterium]|nr:carboxymuconolactone decarboxylase family protein [Thermoanaerobaculia bacterium]
MSAQPPKFNRDFRESHPDVWKAFNDLADKCHEAGPLDEKARRLIKVALAIGLGVEGGAHSAARNARAAGVTQEELDHIAVLGITTIGFPASMRALAWINDPAAQPKKSRSS